MLSFAIAEYAANPKPSHITYLGYGSKKYADIKPTKSRKKNLTLTIIYFLFFVN
tara:strand:- start:1082 stop:1243 length:162 start_codon:yes stop_codon:yes gene_type:complete